MKKLLLLLFALSIHPLLAQQTTVRAKEVQIRTIADPDIDALTIRNSSGLIRLQAGVTFGDEGFMLLSSSASSGSIQIAPAIAQNMVSLRDEGSNERVQLGVLDAGDSGYMSVTGTTPKVGIGVSSPTLGNLHIKSTGSANLAVQSGDAGQAEIRIRRTTGDAGWSIYKPPNSLNLNFWDGTDRVILPSGGGLRLMDSTGAAIRTELAVDVSDRGRVQLYNSSSTLEVLLQAVGAAATGDSLDIRNSSGTWKVRAGIVDSGASGSVSTAGTNDAAIRGASTTALVGLYVNSTRVVGVQQAAVADCTDGTNTCTQLNALLARLRTHGLIAP